MQTNTTERDEMSLLTLKFDDDNSFDGLRKHTYGSYKGKWVLRIDGHEFVDKTREALALQVIQFLRDAIANRKLSVVKVGDEVCVIASSAFGIDIHRVTLGEDGVQRTRSTGFTGGDIKEEEQASLMHMAQQAWDKVNDEPPSYLDAEHKADYTHWVKWQRSYQSFIDSGCDSTEAHAKACGYA